jgi:hypothetical protein
MSSLKNLIIDQGTTFKEFINYVDKTGTAINVTGFAARSQMKKSYNSANSTTFSANVETSANGNVSISLTAAQSSNVKAGRYVYDVELYNSNSNVVYRIQEGTVTVYPEVTK